MNNNFHGQDELKAVIGKEDGELIEQLAEIIKSQYEIDIN